MSDRHLSHRVADCQGGVRVHGLESAVSVGLLCVVALTSQAPAQSLQERLDESKFIRGLSEFQLPEVLEHYIAAHPPDDPIQAAQYRIAVQRTVSSDRSLSAHERQAGADRLLEIRGELIRDHPEDVRRAVWLADQAADLQFVVLPIEASGLTSQFGLPSPRQRARAQRVAREMNELTEEAEIEIERAILALESTPGYASDLTVQMARRRLAEEERNRRIPFLRGLGAYLHAELNLPPPDHRRRLYELAAELLEPLGDTLPAGLGAWARLHAGLALTRLDESEAGQRLLEAVLSDPNTDRRIAFAARMGILRNLIAQQGAPAGLQALDSVQQHFAASDDLFFRVLIADQRFLLRTQLASHATGQQRDDLLRQALDAYIVLLDAEVDVPRDTVRRIVFARLTAAAEIAAPPEGVAVIVTVAQAHHLAQHPDTHAQAIDLFQQLLARPDLDRRDRAEVLFGLAGVLLADDQLPASAQRFAQLSREHPTAREAERSIEMAVTIATGLYEQAPGDAQSRELLREVLQLVMTRYPNLETIDRWRYTAGRLALAERVYEQALDFFRQVAPDAERWLDAQFMRATAVRSWADTETDPAGRRHRYQQLLDVTQEIRPAIERGVDSAENQGQTGLRSSYVASLKILEAEALLELDEPQRAVETLQDSDTDPSLDSTMKARAVLTRIDAYYALGRTAEVERELERLLEVAANQAGAILDAMLEARRRGVMALIDMSRSEEAAEQARKELLPLANALGRWLATHTAGRQPPATLRLHAADAYRLAEHWNDALPLYDRILQDHPHAVDALFGRGECLFGLGDDQYANAMEIYKRIAASAGDGDDYYWQSQLRMLQILDRTNRNTHRIAPHIQRLRQRDRQLGGERLRRAFETLQNKYS